MPPVIAPRAFRRSILNTLVARKYPTIMGTVVIISPYTKKETLMLFTKLTPPGTPAPMRKNTRPSSLMKLRVLLSILRSISPICPICPTMSPATRQPPELPSEKLIPGILKAPIRQPSDIAMKKGRNP